MGYLKLTDKQQKVLGFLYGKDVLISPTAIGEHFGKPYSQASAWACPVLSKLRGHSLVHGLKGRYIISPLGKRVYRSLLEKNS